MTAQTAKPYHEVNSSRCDPIVHGEISHEPWRAVLTPIWKLLVSAEFKSIGIWWQVFWGQVQSRMWVFGLQRHV